MRPLLVFLACLVIGIAALWFAAGSRGGGSESGTRPAPPEVSGPDAPLSAFAPGKGAIPEGVGISRIEGLTTWIPREEVRGGVRRELPPIEVRIRALQPAADGSAELEGPVFLVPDEDGRPRTEITAKRGRGHFAGNPPSPAGGPWSLQDATIAHRDPGSPLGAITLTCEEVRARFDRDGKKANISTFETDRPFVVSGDAARGGGTGFLFDLLADRYEITKDASMELSPGSSPGLRDRVRLRSKGKTTIERSQEKDGERLAVTASDGAFFRTERQGSARFLETEADEIAARLAPEGGREAKSYRPERFAARGNVVFRTEQLEGSCTEARGSFDTDRQVREAALSGPYRVDLRLPRGGRGVPGLGEPKGAALQGPGSITATRIANREGAYLLEARERSSVQFVEPESANPASVVADRLFATYGPAGLERFRAEGRVEIQGSYGTLRGDEADLTGLDAEPTLVLRSTSLVSLDLAAAPSGVGAGGSLALKARAVTFVSVAAESSTRILAEGAVDGRSGEPGSAVLFQSNRLETTVGKDRPREVTLDGAVRARFEERGLRFEGGHLWVREEARPGATAARRGELVGSPAVIEILEGGVARRTIRSPSVAFGEASLEAEGPVSLELPASSLADAPGAASPLPNETIRLSGSRLYAALAASGKPERATLQGPVRGEGAYEVSGDRLEVNFATSAASLFGSEGSRASIARAASAGSPGFRASAPRLDSETAGRALVLSGGGSLVIEGASLDLRAVAARPAGRRGTSTVRFESAGDARIDAQRAVFAESVRVSSEDRGGWNLRSDLLQVDFDARRAPSVVTATGHVAFDVSGKFHGEAARMRYAEATALLELEGTREAPASLEFGLGRFVGSWVRFNLRSYLVETGPARLFESQLSTARAAGGPL